MNAAHDCLLLLAPENGLGMISHFLPLLFSLCPVSPLCQPCTLELSATNTLLHFPCLSPLLSQVCGYLPSRLLILIPPRLPSTLASSSSDNLCPPHPPLPPPFPPPLPLPPLPSSLYSSSLLPPPIHTPAPPLSAQLNPIHQNSPNLAT